MTDQHPDHPAPLAWDWLPDKAGRDSLDCESCGWPFDPQDIVLRAMRGPDEGAAVCSGRCAHDAEHRHATREACAKRARVDRVPRPEPFDPAADREDPWPRESMLDKARAEAAARNARHFGTDPSWYGQDPGRGPLDKWWR